MLYISHYTVSDWHSQNMSFVSTSILNFTYKTITELASIDTDGDTTIAVSVKLIVLYVLLFVLVQTVERRQHDWELCVSSVVTILITNTSSRT